MPTYTFAGINCPPRASEAVPQINPGESLYSVRSIPYSTASVLDIGGIGVRRYAAEVRLDPDDAADFEALLQASDELVVNNVTYARATLVQLGNKTITPRGEWVFYR